jgi:hypothetical protein
MVGTAHEAAVKRHFPIVKVITELERPEKLSMHSQLFTLVRISIK